MSATEPLLKFSRPLAVSRVTDRPVEIVIDADPGACRALADRFGLHEVRWFRATVDVRRVGPGAGDVRLTGRINAEMWPVCVVTLEPFRQALSEAFSLRYLMRQPQPDDGADEEEEEVECDLDGEDTEPLTAGIIDVGEVVAQYFGLALDAHPRAPDAQFQHATPDDSGVAADSRPFSALLAWGSGTGRS